jgi:hypothetical protein
MTFVTSVASSFYYEMFVGFDIMELAEREFLGIDVSGKNRVWHGYVVVARKN